MTNGQIRKLAEKVALERYPESYQNEHLSERMYRYKSVNAMADRLFQEKRGFVQRELCFCCEKCAEEYFDYYPEAVGHYKRVSK